MKRGCPCKDETPDPCPKCGATVKGDDLVNGICQADKLDAVVITDEMIVRAIDALRPDMARIAPKMGGWSHSEKTQMRAVLEAALLR